MRSSFYMKQPVEGNDVSGRNENMNNDEDDGGGPSWMMFLGLGFLTFDSVKAIYRYMQDVALFTISYLLLLFACLRLYKHAPPPLPSPRRAGWLKASVWVLTMLLTVMFSHKVAAIVPPLLAAVLLIAWLRQLFKRLRRWQLRRSRWRRRGLRRGSRTRSS